MSVGVGVSDVVRSMTCVACRLSFVLPCLLVLLVLLVLSLLLLLLPLLPLLLLLLLLGQVARFEDKSPETQRDYYFIIIFFLGGGGQLFVETVIIQKLKQSIIWRV